MALKPENPNWATYPELIVPVATIELLLDKLISLNELNDVEKIVPLKLDTTEAPLLDTGLVSRKISLKLV